MSSEDIFGIPFNWETLYSDNKPITRKCSHCKQKGHNRRTCKSFQLSKKACLVTGINFSTEVNTNCFCTNCYEYRRYNCPTPKKAVCNLKRIHAENKRKFPLTDVINKLDKYIYIWEIDGYLRLLGVVEPGERLTFSLDKPVLKGEVRNVIVTDIYIIRNKIHLENIDIKNILQQITIEHGESYEYDILEPDNQINEWMEAALKSRYLLQQLERLGVSRNPNYEPIMDLIQDINFPECSENDKEHSGIPSELTNIV